MWGREWDALLAQDTEGALVQTMNDTVDGDYQTFKGSRCQYVREHFFNKDPRLAMVADYPTTGSGSSSAAATTTWKALRRVQGGYGAQGAADGDPRQDGEGLDAGFHTSSRATPPTR